MFREARVTENPRRKVDSCLPNHLAWHHFTDRQRSGEPLSPHAAITSSATSLVLRPKFDLIPWSSQLICLPNPSGCRSLGFAVDFALCSILPGLSDRLGDPPSLLLPQTGGGGLGVEVERLLKPVMLLSYYNAFSTGPLPVCLSPAASVPTLLTPS